MNTQAELRAFTIGCVSGIVILFSALIAGRYVFGVTWHPVIAGQVTNRR